MPRADVSVVAIYVPLQSPGRSNHIVSGPSNGVNEAVALCRNPFGAHASVKGGDTATNCDPVASSKGKKVVAQSEFDPGLAEIEPLRVDMFCIRARLQPCCQPCSWGFSP